MPHEAQSAVFGIYANPAALEAALERLRAKGFQSADISVLSTQNPAFAGLVAPKESDAPAQAPSGPSAVSAVGGALGWLVGLTALAMAGGIFIVAGPLMAVFARMGEAAGDIATALSGIGVPAEQARHYELRITSGGTLLSVLTNTPEWVAQGRQILEDTGAEAVTWTGTDATTPPVVA